jgi:hypothetical protein
MGLAEPLAKLGLGLSQIFTFFPNLLGDCCHILNSVADAEVSGEEGQCRSKWIKGGKFGEVAVLHIRIMFGTTF